MTSTARWQRYSPNSTNNFDLMLINTQELDFVLMNGLLDEIEKVTRRTVTLSIHARNEFRRWFGQPHTPLKSDAYVRLSNWFLTHSGDRHSMVATRCEALWDALFPCRPLNRLSSSAPQQNHVVESAEFESFWHRLSAVQGEGANADAGSATVELPKSTLETKIKGTAVGPLTIAQAKQGLALSLGVLSEAIEITIRG